MAPKPTEADRLAAMKKRHEELDRYQELFAAAFDELHSAVVRQVKTPNQYVGPHHDYPIMTMNDGGFPHFTEAGYYRDGSPRDYVSTMRPNTLAGLLGGYRRPEQGFPKGEELAEFLRTHDVGKRLDLGEFVYDGVPSDWAVDHLVGDAVERYLHLYGLDEPVVPRRRDDIIWALMGGTVVSPLKLRLVVPITLTHFQVDRFRLSKTAYITRIPKKLQLARARISTLGTGAVQMVVGAATHAFVSTDWELKVETTHEVARSLRNSSPNVADAIDSFLGALRVATGISTGYAQVLYVPRKWALSYFCDLTPVYGTTMRQYPSDWDDYGWTHGGATVTREQLVEVRRIYEKVTASQSEAIRLSLRRLNSCLTRTDAADAILDGTIGLELLLSDDENQALSYKLRLRAGALALLDAQSSRTPTDVAVKVKKLYEARSGIVHGRRRKGSKKAAEPVDRSHAEQRVLASDLLRFVLDTLLTHPEYQSPQKIDEDLLLGGPLPAVDQPALVRAPRVAKPKKPGTKGKSA